MHCLAEGSGSCVQINSTHCYLTKLMEGGDDKGWPCHQEAAATESNLSASSMRDN